MPDTDSTATTQPGTAASSTAPPSATAPPAAAPPAEEGFEAKVGRLIAAAVEPLQKELHAVKTAKGKAEAQARAAKEWSEDDFRALASHEANLERAKKLGIKGAERYTPTGLREAIDERFDELSGAGKAQGEAQPDDIVARITRQVLEGLKGQPPASAVPTATPGAFVQSPIRGGNAAVSVSDDDMDKAWLEGRITDEEYRRRLGR